MKSKNMLKGYLMSMTKYAEISKNLEVLNLTKMVEVLPSILKDLESGKTNFLDGLYALTNAEINFRDERARKINVVVSNFPFQRTLKQFDFDYQPTINRAEIEGLASLRFIDEKSNIIFIGNSGVGKTHLATAIGIEAASQRVSTYYINFVKLMEIIKSAAREGRLEKVIKHYLKYAVLIIDEIGYVPVDKDASYGFFQLVAARYEFRPTIITTNLPFSKRTEVFGDASLTAAIIDRLVHHCSIIKINGISYRLRGKGVFEEDK